MKIEKITEVCKNCKYFSVGDDGIVERYECLNEKRWEDLGYDEDAFCDDDIYLIAIARYNSKGVVVDAELLDMDFNFDGCKWKEEVKNEGKNILNG